MFLFFADAEVLPRMTKNKIDKDECISARHLKEYWTKTCFWISCVCSVG